MHENLLTGPLLCRQIASHAVSNFSPLIPVRLYFAELAEASQIICCGWTEVSPPAAEELLS